MKFTKMNGLGNDFIVVHTNEIPLNRAEMAVAMCDRHFGIGADGLVFILPSDIADFQMRIINADGSEAEQCGNAIRCVAKYVYDYGLTDKTEVKIETLAGIQEIQLSVENNQVKLVRVDMGEPILEGRRIPTSIESQQVVNYPITVNGHEYHFTAVSMGNPHAVIYVENVADFPLQDIGPKIETHRYFPRKTNVEFVTVHHPEEVTMRVWERGAGQTLACGTGACAVVVSSVLNQKTSRNVLVHLKGGDLSIEWDEVSNHVFMTGPAEIVFSGIWLKS